MIDNSREATIAKYTDKSRYKPEHIYGDVYVDEARVALSKTNDEEREIFYFIDFKKAIGTDRSIIKKLERGVGQAEGIIISIENETSIDKAVQWLNGVLNTMTNPHDGFIVIIEDIDGKYGIYTVNGKRLSVEENLFTAAQRFSPPDN